MPTFNVEVPEMYRYLVANTVDEVVEKVMIRLRGGGLEALNDQSMDNESIKNAIFKAPLDSTAVQPARRKHKKPAASEHQIALDPKHSPPMLTNGDSASEIASPSIPTQIVRSHADIIDLPSPTSDSKTTPTSESKATTTSESNTKASAHQLKRKFSRIRGRGPSGKRLTGECDPENREILRLRQEEDMEFDAIARVLNEQRVKKGSSPHLTSNAIYSRYKRNGPLIAASEGRHFTPTSKDKKPNGQGIKFKETTPISGFDAEQDELLVKAYSDIEGRKWELVAARLNELGGKLHEPVMCARRYECI